MVKFRPLRYEGLSEDYKAGRGLHDGRKIHLRKFERPEL